MGRDVNNKYWDEELETLPVQNWKSGSWPTCRRSCSSLTITHRIISAASMRQA